MLIRNRRMTQQACCTLMQLVVENSERSNTREDLLSNDEVEQLKEAV